MHIHNGTIAWWIYAVLLLAYFLLQFIGSYFIGLEFYIKTFCKANTNEKIISLSFDDGPVQNFTPRILDILKEYNVSSCFFCIGQNIQQNEALLKRIDDEGHIIGNHSFSHHTWFDLFSTQRMIAEMQQTNDLVRQLTGKTMNWFRPPYGVTNPSLTKAIKKMDYKTIGWSIRSYDTMAKDSNRLLSKLKKSLKPGAIILLHDKCSVTVEILPAFLQFVKDEGYKIVPMDKLLHLNPYA